MGLQHPKYREKQGKQWIFSEKACLEWRNFAALSAIGLQIKPMHCWAYSNHTAYFFCVNPTNIDCVNSFGNSSAHKIHFFETPLKKLSQKQKEKKKKKKKKKFVNIDFEAKR